jgi:hypothetical protein
MNIDIGQDLEVVLMMVVSALFVAIGSGAMSGPLCLLIAFTFWASVVFCIAQCRKADPEETQRNSGLTFLRDRDRHALSIGWILYSPRWSYG